MTRLGEVLIESLQSLLKAEHPEDDPESILNKLQGIVSDREHKTLRRHLFEDALTPGIGNALSFQTYKAKNKPGYWASIDVNSLKHINSAHGHTAGDQAIGAVGRAIREAIDESPYKKSIKAFRSGGDEGAIASDDPKALHHIIRSVHTKLDQVPLVGGTHKVSISTGLGNSYEEADKSLFEAKKGKVNKETGQSYGSHEMPHLTHSSIK